MFIKIVLLSTSSFFMSVPREGKIRRMVQVMVKFQSLMALAMTRTWWKPSRETSSPGTPASIGMT